MKASENIKKNTQNLKTLVVLALILIISIQAIAQSTDDIKWSGDGSSYYALEDNNLIQYTLPGNVPKVLIPEKMFTPGGTRTPLNISYYDISNDNQKVLIFTNTKKVWRLKTKGDYWVLDIKTGSLIRLGKSFPSSTLMFAKFSPDCKSVGYVYGNNIYVEDLATSQIKPLTTDGTKTLINGTFDWVYEEEFSCRDGFRWSPDSKSIAYWQIDAGSIKKFYMINNTDSIYSRIIPIEYPKTGENPSACRVGVVTVADAKTTWMNIEGDPEQNYIVRMEFIPWKSSDLLIQQLNRKQNISKLIISNIISGNSKVIQEERDDAWVDIYQPENTYSVYFTNKYIWLNDSQSILWDSEKDGWRHFYRISLEEKPEILVTKGNYDIIGFKYIDQKKGFVYFMASPENAAQKYLYRTRLDGKGSIELLSPPLLKGTHDYTFSPNGQFAYHTFSNHSVKPAGEFISVAGHKPLNDKESIAARLDILSEKSSVEFFRITTTDNIELDGWMKKPVNFDPSRKYPVVFFVYTEPASTTVNDTYGIDQNRLYDGDMAEDGYIYISLDNRGTPAPKGRLWRKAIYRQVGRINIRDQALAAKEIMKWNFVDPERIAVWGWSGGGSATLNLMFQYPEIYKTGISIAALDNLLTYDNIYQERYMGLPSENMDDYIKGSPVTHAKNLTGNLLIIHGTGDDNVHYQNAEMLLNELIKYNRQFQIMPYPNRTHSIREGEGTTDHLHTLFTNYLRKFCPPGGK